MSAGQQSDDDDEGFTPAEQAEVMRQIDVIRAEAKSAPNARQPAVVTNEVLSGLVGTIGVSVEAALVASKTYTRRASYTAIEVIGAQVKELIALQATQGPPGDIGPMPQHQWDGPRLRFEEEPGVWGDWQDLRGPRGLNGYPTSGYSGATAATESLTLDGGGAADGSTALDGGSAADDLPGIPGVGGGGAATTYSGAAFNGGRAG